jgi:uncharacterized membrane protein
MSNQSLWMDEVYTLNISVLPWPQMQQVNLQSDNGKPPLYYLLMKHWLPYGESEAWVRLPSVIFGALTCITACLIGRCFLGNRGWILGLLLAISPLHIWYSQETRMYAMLGLFGSLAFYFHLRFCQKRKLPDLILFGIFGILTCYSFPYGFFFLPVTAVCAFFYRPSLKLKELITDAVAHVLIFGTFCLWISRMIQAAQTTTQDYKGQHFLVLCYTIFNLFLGPSVGLSPDQLRQGGLHAFSLHPGGAVLLVLAFILCLAIFFIGLRILLRENWNAFIFAVAGCIFLIGFPCLVALLKSSVTNNPRYSFLALFPILLVVGVFYLNAWDKPLWIDRILGSVFAGFLALSLTNYYFVPEYGRDNVRIVAQYLMKSDDKVDLVFVCDLSDADTFRYYYRGSAPIIGLTFRSNVSEAEEWAEIESASIGFNHPALVYLRADHGDPKHRLPALFQNRFHLLEEKNWPGVTAYKYDAQNPSSSTP